MTALVVVVGLAAVVSQRTNLDRPRKASGAEKECAAYDRV
jgi:hypothetical protein